MLRGVMCSKDSTIHKLWFQYRQEGFKLYKNDDDWDDGDDDDDDDNDDDDDDGRSWITTWLNDGCWISLSANEAVESWAE